MKENHLSPPCDSYGLSDHVRYSPSACLSDSLMNDNSDKIPGPRITNFNLATLMILLLISGPAISYVYFNWWRSSDFTGSPTRPVLVAALKLEPNTELTRENTRIENWPADLVPEKMERAAGTVNGRFTTHSISKGQPLFVASTKTLNEIFGDRLEGHTPTRNVMVLDMPIVNGSNGMLQPGDRLMVVDAQDHNRIIVGPTRIVIKFESSPPSVAYRIGLEMTDEQARKYLDAKRGGAVEYILAPDSCMGK